jgi:hypothetical protein
MKCLLKLVLIEIYNHLRMPVKGIIIYFNSQNALRYRAV